MYLEPPRQRPPFSWRVFLRVVLGFVTLEALFHLFRYGSIVYQDWRV